MLANDPVAKWLAYFLESFREHNPATEVIIIPYSAEIERVRAIGAIYGCSVINYDFACIDAFAEQMFTDSKKRGRLRKLAVFDSAADISVYVDIDVLVTSSLELSLPEVADVELIYGTKSGDNVYALIPAAEQLRARSHFFSSGLLILNEPSRWTSVRGILEFIGENKDEYLVVRAPFVIDQPLLNYYIDNSVWRAVAVSDVWKDVSPHNWYNDPVLKLTSDGVRDRYDRKVLFIHWAGEQKNSDTSLRFSELKEQISERIRIRCGSLVADIL